MPSFLILICLILQICCREKAVIFILCRNSDLNDLKETLKNFEEKFNAKFKYPYVILNNDDFTDDFKNQINEIVSTKVEYGKICSKAWNRPDNIDINKAKENWQEMSNKGIPYANVESYHNMCRYFSRKFFDHPLVKKYKYYWRVEPGVRFHCDIEEDPFKILREKDMLYGFTITLHEYMDTIKSLEKVTNDYIERKKIKLPEPEERINFMFPEGKYNGCHFWSNFEIASFDLWRSDEYRDYVDELESKQGFYMERWGDAPVHSIYIGKFISKKKVLFLDYIGYTHPPFTHCPATCKNSTCDKDKSFDNNPFSCLTLYMRDYGKLTFNLSNS